MKVKVIITSILAKLPSFAKILNVNIQLFNLIKSSNLSGHKDLEQYTPTKSIRHLFVSPTFMF